MALNTLSRERVAMIRSATFRSIGLMVVIYCFCSTLLSLFTLITLIVRSLCSFPWLVKESDGILTLRLSVALPLAALISWSLTKSSHRFASIRPQLFSLLCLIICLSLLVFPFGQIHPHRPLTKIAAEDSSRSTTRDEHSSLYAAYTDLSCPRSRPRISSSIVDHYRAHSPFPVYLSILKSNGPQCFAEDRHSSCATTESSSSLVRYFIPLVVVLLLLAGVSRSRRTVVTKAKPLNENVEKIFRRWLDNADHLEQVRQACREALNHVLATTDQSLSVENLQFRNPRVHHLVEEKNDAALIITGVLDLDQLVLHLRQRSTPLELGQFTGVFRLNLLATDEQYQMEMQFEKIQLNAAGLVDQPALIEFFRAAICRTVVPCSFHLTDDQNNQITGSEVPATPEPLLTNDSVIVEETSDLSPTPALSPEPSSPVPLLVNKVLRKKLIVCIVKAVKLHDVEQPYCLLELNEPKQTHQTNLAKNGVNPFWDERFVFDWNEKSHQLHLQIFDRAKAKKKKNRPTSTHASGAADDRLYADISIPLTFLSHSTDQKDIPISPSHPDSIVRLKFSIVVDEDDSLADSAIEHDFPQSQTDAIVTLAPPHQMDFKDDQSLSEASQVKPSLLCSFKHLRFSRRTPHSKTNHSVVSSNASTVPSASRSFRQFFRAKPKKTTQPIQSGNFIVDHQDLPSTSTPVAKKRSFFQRHKLKTKKEEIVNLSANSLDSYDCSRSESARNTPVRANVGRPVTMTKSLVR